MTEMSAMTAMTNIGANLSEISGVISGSICLVTFWIPRVCGAVGFTKNMCWQGLAVTVAALCVPWLVNGAAETNEALGLIVSMAVTVAVIWASWYLLFYPARIAKARNHRNAEAIGLFNWAFIVPFVFLGLLIWASMGKADPTAGPPVVSARESLPEEPPAQSG